MKNKFIYSALIVFCTSVVSCNDPYNDDIDPSKLDLSPIDAHPVTELDQWIFENFTVPYNIEVKYRFDASEINVNSTLVPPMPSKVKTIMNVVKEAWILPYINEAGSTFLKTFCPKQFVLVGSPQYNPGGTITLGTAEGGRKVVLFVINDFDDTSRRKIKEQMHTIHHEFGHILHQNVPYSNEFKQITPGGYTADWRNISTADAQSRGFITSYAMSAPDEDFVELIAMMLTEGSRGFDRIVCSIPSTSARDLIQRKAQMVINYFQEVYDIDFYELQEKTDAAIDVFAPKTLIADLGFNSGQNFNVIEVNPDALPPLPADFKNIYDAASAGVGALDIDGSALQFEYLQLIFVGDDNNTILLRALISIEGDEGLYAADRTYTASITPNNIVTLNFERQNGNAEFIESGMQPLIDYFEDHTFYFDWIPADSDDCVHDFGGIFPEELGDTYNAFGILGSL